MTLRYKDLRLLRLGSGLLDIAMMQRPWVAGVEVPGEKGGMGGPARVVPLEWWWAPGPASCSEDRHKGHDGAAAIPGSAGSPRFAWTCH